MLHKTTLIRPVSQVILDLPTHDPERTFYRCLAVVLEWVSGEGRERS